MAFLQRYLMVGIVVFFGAAESRADFVGQTVEFQYSGCEMFSTVVPSTGYSYPQPGWYCNPYLGVELTGSNLTLSEVPPASETIYGGSLTSPTLITLRILPTRIKSSHRSAWTPQRMSLVSMRPACLSTTRTFTLTWVGSQFTTRPTSTAVNTCSFHRR